MCTCTGENIDGFVTEKGCAREGDRQTGTPLYHSQSERSHAVPVSPPRYRLLFFLASLPSHTDCTKFWMGQGRGDDPPATTHLASGLPARRSTHRTGWLGSWGGWQSGTEVAPF